MATIEELVRGVRGVDEAGLRGVDAEELARYVLDTTHEWWRRRPCAAALAGRVPEPFAPALLECIEDHDDVAEVRIALLDVLGDRPELLPWLRHPDPVTEGSYGMPEAILKARGVAGDRTAAPALATLADDEWPHRRAAGDAGLAALVERYGAEAIAADLGDARPEDRAFQVRLRHRSGGDVTDALADPDVGVAHLAHQLADDVAALRRCVERAPTLDAKVWAACALYRLRGDRAEARAIHDSLGRPRVEVDGLDEEVRGAILREYAPRCQRRSDPRWRLEAICAEPPPPPEEAEQLRRATAALASARLAPGRPVPCGEAHRQGRGTYHVVEIAGGSVWVSTLGRFVTGEARSEAGRAARGALEAAGFRWVDEALGSITVTGLGVYFFGDRDPLPVSELLFYWQD